MGLVIPLAVVGAGSHGHAVAEVAHACNIETIFHDDDRTKGAPIDAIDGNGSFILGVNDSRARAELLSRIAGHPVRLRHPRSLWGNGCKRGHGSVIAAGAILTRDVWIGDHTHINVGVTISQGSRLGDFVTVSPNATICGEVHIGDCSMIGAGAVVSNLVTIGADVTVGAGAVVLRDVADGETVVGVPAKPVLRVEPGSDEWNRQAQQAETARTRRA